MSDYILSMRRARANAIAERKSGDRSRSFRRGERSQARTNAALKSFDAAIASHKARIDAQLAAAALSAVSTKAAPCAD